MKLIFLNRFFFPDLSATSQLLSDLAFDLARAGNDIHVITGRQRYDDVTDTLPPQSLIRGVHVHRVWTSRFGRQRLSGRAVDVLTFYLTAAWRLIWLFRKDDVVIVKTDPPLISVVASLIVTLRGAAVVNWIQDLFPEVAIGLNINFTQGGLGRRLIRLRNSALLCAAMNVVPGELMSQRLTALGLDPRRVKTIHNWADGRAIFPVAPDQNPLRREWGLEERFVVG